MPKSRRQAQADLEQQLRGHNLEDLLKWEAEVREQLARLANQLKGHIPSTAARERVQEHHDDLLMELTVVRTEIQRQRGERQRRRS